MFFAIALVGNHIDVKRQATEANTNEIAVNLFITSLLTVSNPSDEFMSNRSLFNHMYCCSIINQQS